MYKAIEYNSKEEVLAAYRKMIERKRKWIEETEQELARLRERTLNHSDHYESTQFKQIKPSRSLFRLACI